MNPSDSKKHNYLPVLLDVTERNILMIGAGLACREKLRTLSLCGKTIRVISPSFHEDFLDKEWIIREERRYRKGDLLGYDVVYAGISNPQVSELIREEAEAIRSGNAGYFLEDEKWVSEHRDYGDSSVLSMLMKKSILINFVDKPSVSDFISPAVLMRNHFAVFISTFGRGPGFTKRIRQRIEENMDLDALDEEAGIYIENRNKRNSRQQDPA